MKATLVCQNCGQEFEVYKSWVRRGRRKFCTWECRVAHQRTLTGEASPRWGKTHTAEARERMSAAVRATNQTHDRNPNWRGGKYTDTHGYRHVAAKYLTPKTLAIVGPMVTKGGYVLEHRLVAALELGRPLTAGEVVHHLNGDKMDNRPENLEVADRSKHSQEHRLIERELSVLRKENAGLRSLLATCLIVGAATSSQPAKT